MAPIALSILASGLALTALGTPPKVATTVFPQQFTRPVGGETFEDFVVGSYTSYGQRPDGRTYGTLPFIPLVECPVNGFLLFEEAFSAEEIEQLAPLVASAEYQAMRESETPHYRAWWLMRALRHPPERLASALLVASWKAMMTLPARRGTSGSSSKRRGTPRPRAAIGSSTACARECSSGTR